MSLVSYLHSQEISAILDWEFSALIMAALRKADSSNFVALAAAFPDIAAEFQARYDAPNGALDDGERAWFNATARA